jgi:valyl-tRNA synthetase
VGEIRWLQPAEAAPRGSVLQLAGGGLEVFMVLQGLVDFAAEAKKLRAVVEELRSKLSALQTRMAAPTYANVPKPVQSKNREQLEELEQKIAATLQAAETMEKSAVA